MKNLFRETDKDGTLIILLIEFVGLLVLLILLLFTSDKENVYLKLHNAILLICFFIVLSFSIGIKDTIKEIKCAFSKFLQMQSLNYHDKLKIIQTVNISLVLVALIYIIDWQATSQNYIKIVLHISVILIIFLWPVIRRKLRKFF